MSFTTSPLPNSTIGVQITDLDLSKPLSEETKKALYDLWIDAGLICFKGLGHNDEEHLRLSEVFGENKAHTVKHLVKEGENDKFMVLDSRDFEKFGTYYRESDPEYIFTGYLPWHSDQIFTVRPNHGALLRIVTQPSRGGKTGWIDTIAAYDALDDEFKEKIKDIELEYELCHDHMHAKYGRDETIIQATEIDPDAPKIDNLAPVAHPAVAIHPISGKKILNVSPLHLVRVVGMEEKESDKLIKQLVAHVTNMDCSYVHDWEPNDMMLWDNWRTLHTAYGYPTNEIRKGMRTQMDGGIDMGRYI